MGDALTTCANEQTRSFSTLFSAKPRHGICSYTQRGLLSRACPLSQFALSGAGARGHMRSLISFSM